MNDNLPPNCPMLKNHYEHYCPSPVTGPLTYKEEGHCFKQETCQKLVKDFKDMKIPTTDTIKIFK